MLDGWLLGVVPETECLVWIRRSLLVLILKYLFRIFNYMHGCRYPIFNTGDMAYMINFTLAGSDPLSGKNVRQTLPGHSTLPPVYTRSSGSGQLIE